MTRFSIKTGINLFLQAAKVTPCVYLGELPQNPSYPATVFDVVSDVVINHTHDPNVVGFRRARVQIDVFALTMAEAEDVMERYFELLAGYMGELGAGFENVSIFDAGQNPDLDFKNEPTLRNIEGRSRDFYILY
jgi:hypothetical protein